MTFNFQILYRRLPSEKLETVEAWGNDERELRESLENAGFQVCRITKGRPVVDWDKPVFNRQEAAAFLNVAVSGVEHLQSKGLLPKAKNGISVFTRKHLESVIDAKMEGGLA